MSRKLTVVIYFPQCLFAVVRPDLLIKLAVDSLSVVPE